MYQRILVPYDGSAASVQGLDEAIRLARLTGGSLRLVHLVEALYFASGFETAAVRAGEVVPLMRRAGTRILQAGQARVEQAGLSVDTWLVEHIAIRLADEVGEQVRHWGADLIVIGTHGRRGVGRLLLGSDAEQIVRTATVPVLLVRARQAARDASANDSAGGAVVTAPCKAPG